jgi:hypothetical protein
MILCGAQQASTTLILATTQENKTFTYLSGIAKRILSGASPFSCFAADVFGQPTQEF